MLGDRDTLDPQRIRLGSPDDEAERLVERPRCLSLGGDAERHPFDGRPRVRVIDACRDDGTPEPAPPMAWRDIHAPDARAMALLRPRLAGDARHRDEPCRIVGIGDRKDGAVGVREAIVDRCKLAEAAVVRR